ncbi:hypothetical protein SAMN04488512_1395 [Sulfitobacter litoralis]|uniref:Uncharacterized protein n=1 Tax=Sulfitobacter litoralis TaxID=335975 RepID=A0ABY0SZ56_9RHOB|nr:hypothetical protein [Sulfitobacter litoralis]SDP76595.1 hypothetical protein SAMN04488512_1395 [Sulfitobacter litoralis]
MTRQEKGPDRHDKTDNTSETRPALNDWGIPDWRDEETYGDVKKWTLDRWRWEFFRRREDLRKFFDDRAKAQYRSNQAMKNAPNIASSSFEGLPSEPGFGVSSPDCADLFGYISVPNPRIGNQPSGIIKPLANYQSFKITDGGRIPKDYIYDEGDFNKWYCVPQRQDMSATRKPSITSERKTGLSAVPFRYFPVALKKHELAINFDINKPIDQQVKEAREILISIQLERHGKALQVRRHTKKWLSYLRTLDAREAGASWSEISTLHPESQQTDQTGRDKWNQARSLCFNL